VPAKTKVADFSKVKNQYTSKWTKLRNGKSQYDPVWQQCSAYGKTVHRIIISGFVLEVISTMNDIMDV